MGGEVNPAAYAERRGRPILTLDRVSKRFEHNGGFVEVLKPMSLSVYAGELLVLVGPSGCGKSTLLKLIAGLERPSSGRIELDDMEIKGPGADRGMVFQDYTSFPWLTVERNVAFGLRLKRASHFYNRVQVRDWLRLVDLEEFSGHYPKSLSGGMQQRLAIARTLANEPRVLLMDEPFGSLDAQTRWQMQDLLIRIRRETRTTIVFVTHDVEETIFLGDRVVVLSARPAQMIDEIRIPYGADRPREIRRSKEFLDLEARIHASIRGGLV